MGGCDQLEAFIRTGLDASVTPHPIVLDRSSADWRVISETLAPDERGAVQTQYKIETPYSEGSSEGSVLGIV